MEWAEIITYISDKLNLSAVELAEKTKVSGKYIHDLKTGKSKNPKTDFIKSLVTELGVNPIWILTGSGEPFNDSINKQFPEDKSINSPVFCGGTKLEGARTVDLAINDDEENEDDDETMTVDFYGQMAGAGPAQEIEAYQPMTPLKIMRKFLNPWRSSQVKALEIKGDSMTKVGLFDRDIVLFVPEEKEGDGIFVISIENRMQVKRLEFDILGENLKIISENDRYEPRVLKGVEELNRVIIEGKVVGWLHRHPY
jgi:SOS-response transcriptional repressor LexA